MTRGTGRDIFRRYKRMITVIDRISLFLPMRIFIFVFAVFRYTPGLIGIAIRYLCARRLLAACGDNLRIGRGCTIERWNSIACGSNVSLHANCHLDGLGGITIGDNVSVAHDCSILSFEHTWRDKGKPIKYNPLSARPVLIANDVWIGCGVRVLAGAEISERTVVGAGAVLPAGVYGPGLVLGVPAKTRPLPE